MKQKENVKPI